MHATTHEQETFRGKKSPSSHAADMIGMTIPIGVADKYLRNTLAG